MSKAEDFLGFVCWPKSIPLDLKMNFKIMWYSTGSGLMALNELCVVFEICLCEKDASTTVKTAPTAHCS